MSQLKKIVMIHVDLIYNIDTGEKSFNQNIKFTGDKFYKDKKLRGVIVVKKINFGNL